MNERELRARADAIEAELDRRATPSERQAASAIRNDRRSADVDERDAEELSTSERQARAFLDRPRRGGWIVDGEG